MRWEHGVGQGRWVERTGESVGVCFVLIRSAPLHRPCARQRIREGGRAALRMARTTFLRAKQLVACWLYVKCLNGSGLTVTLRALLLMVPSWEWTCVSEFGRSQSESVWAFVPRHSPQLVYCNKKDELNSTMGLETERVPVVVEFYYLFMKNRVMSSPLLSMAPSTNLNNRRK